jgi:hypothetical protein
MTLFDPFGFRVRGRLAARVELSSLRSCSMLDAGPVSSLKGAGPCVSFLAPDNERSARVRLFNIVVAYVLVYRVGTFDLRDTWEAVAFGAGFFLIATVSAHLFGPLHRGDMKDSQALVKTPL